jgi:hypothetical protein
MVGKTQLETENEMKVAELIQALSEMPQDMPVHFWAKGKRQNIIDVCNVGDCIDMYEDETQCSNVTVYFEAGAGAHEVAQFDNEETYMACFPALEQLAMLKGYTITESVGEAMTDQQKIETLGECLNNITQSAEAYLEDKSSFAIKTLLVDIDIAWAVLNKLPPKSWNL